jgi:hypothetical protein
VLREFSGGRMLVEHGTNLLPRTPTVLPTPLFPSTLFVCGDFFPRCNETPGLTMMHTLFVREHNRKVAEYAAQNPYLNDEQLFQLGRRWVMSLMQSIVVNEFIPTLTGENVPSYDGYKPWVNGRLAMEFTASLYRLGHTLLPRELQRYGSPGGHNPLPSLDLGETLFQSPAIFQTSGDVDALMRGFTRLRSWTASLRTASATPWSSTSRGRRESCSTCRRSTSSAAGSSACRPTTRPAWASVCRRRIISPTPSTPRRRAA